MVSEGTRPAHIVSVLLPSQRRGSHIVGMPQPTNDWTVERVLALPDDGNRYQVVDGELLVSLSPDLYHQDAVLALAVRLLSYARSTSIGHVSISPADRARTREPWFNRTYSSGSDRSASDPSDGARFVLFSWRSKSCPRAPPAMTGR